MRRTKDSADEAESLHVVVCAPHIDGAIEISGSAPEAVGLAGDFLHDIVGGGIEAAKIFAIDYVDRALLANLNEQVLRAGGLIGQEQNAARSQILIVFRESGLIEGRERILDGGDAVG